MEEFLKEYYRLLTHGVEILAAVTGLLLYKKYKLTAAKYFIWFILYLTICEFLGRYSRFVNHDRFLSFLKGSLIEKNYWWFTSFWKVGAIVFFAFYYYKILKTKHFKTIIKWFGVMFLSFSIIYIAFNWYAFFTSFFPILSVLGAIIIFSCTIFYFIELLTSDKILSFYRSINFYISTAIFIWWLIITPIVFYDIYMSEGNDWNFIFLRWQIYLFANIFMYSTFTFALIYCKPEKEDILNN